jgi:hypothetical protein
VDDAQFVFCSIRVGFKWQFQLLPFIHVRYAEGLHQEVILYPWNKLRLAHDRLSSLIIETLKTNDSIQHVQTPREPPISSIATRIMNRQNCVLSKWAILTFPIINGGCQYCRICPCPNHQLEQTSRPRPFQGAQIKAAGRYNQRHGLRLAFF